MNSKEKYFKYVVGDIFEKRNIHQTDGQDWVTLPFVIDINYKVGIIKGLRIEDIAYKTHFYSMFKDYIYSTYAIDKGDSYYLFGYFLKFFKENL